MADACAQKMDCSTSTGRSGRSGDGGGGGGGGGGKSPTLAKNERPPSYLMKPGLQSTASGSTGSRAS